MQMRTFLSTVLGAIFLLVILSSCTGKHDEVGASAEILEAVDIDPWILPAPPPDYSGHLFSLAHDYPTTPIAPPNPTPWGTAIGGGQITPATANAYVMAAKDYIAEDMNVLIYDNDNWDGNARGWYHMPWITTTEKDTSKPNNGFASIRDPLKGTYVGSSFPPEMFPKSGLKEEITTHVLVLYNDVAAASLYKVWGTTGLDPVAGIKAGGAQFPEGSIIVKVALTTLSDPAKWPVIAGAFPWQIYGKQMQICGITNPPSCDNAPEVMQTTYFFQFDIIVKDSVAAPDTNWVFSTLVYDQNAPGSNWDKMVPLGAMWGNDPDILSPQGCDYLTSGGCPTLSQNWINPSAPLYAKETLGWGGRLSGPNDGSVDLNVKVRDTAGAKPVDYAGPGAPRYAMSSCMSCHSSAAWEQSDFLLPVQSNCGAETDSCGPVAPMAYWKTANAEWMKWFQSNSGDVPMTPGSIALDYDMNYAFKAMPSYQLWAGDGTPNFPNNLQFYRGVK